MDTISINDFQRLHDCKEAFERKRLSLRNPGLERASLKKNVLASAMKAFSNGKGVEEVISFVKQMLVNGYRVDWFQASEAYRLALKKDTEHFIRLIRYVYDRTEEVVATDVSYSIPMFGMEYRGMKLEGINGKVDLVIKNKEHHIEAICFKLSEPKYSYAAQLPQNKPENAFQLIAMKLGLNKEYPNAFCSLYYLKSKDDKGTFVAPFEGKKGKNIITHNFLSYDGKSLFHHFVEVAGLPSTITCDGCYFYDCCKFQRNIRVENTVQQEQKKKESKKEVRYTDAQKRVVNHVNGPMNVIAVPGAGKTFSLVQRMLHLIDEGIQPCRILFVTFTRKACEEIKVRVMEALGTEDETKLPTILTFNALGYTILKDNPALIGKRVKLAGTIDRLSIIRDILDDIPRIAGLSYEGMFMKYGIIRSLDSWFAQIKEKGEETFASEYRGKGDLNGILDAYHRYVRAFEAKGYVTYDDQISLCNELFERAPKLAELYSKVYQYIMVDEFQDVSEDNAKLIYTLAHYHNNIVVVGDDDQSIYHFRGGSNRFMLEFADEFENVETVVMNDNFRSNDKILEASELLIGNNTNRYEKHIIPHISEQFRPIVLKKYEPAKMVGLVDRILDKGYKPGDIAILARQNKTLMSISDALSPYCKVTAPKDYIINDATFLAVFDVLTLYYEGVEASDVAVYRLFSWLGCSKGIKRDDKEKSLLDDILNQHNLPLFALADSEVSAFYSHAAEPMAKEAGRIFNALKAVQYARDIRSCIDGILMALFNLETHMVSKVLSDLSDERAISEPRELYYFMRDMKLFGDETRVGYAPTEDAINLLTAHDSKGKEFPVVIIYGSEDFADTEEERRLFYVAMTRAKKSLFIVESNYSVSKLLPEVEKCVAVY